MERNEPFKTSLTREMLLQSFQDAIELNICAKEKYFIFRRNCYKSDGDESNFILTEDEIKGFPEFIKNEIQNVKFITENFSEQNIREVLCKIEKLQNDAKNYLYERMKQKRLQQNSVSTKIYTEENCKDKKLTFFPQPDDYSNTLRNAIQNIANAQDGNAIEELTENSSCSFHEYSETDNASFN